MISSPPAPRSAFRLEWLAPGAITVIAALIYVNSAFFSAFNSPNPDLSINLTAAHAIAHGADPYGETTLLQRAKELKSPTAFIYETLFTSYIQPPTSAMAVMPLTVLPWRQATRAYLVLNNLMLPAALLLTLYTVRPTVPLRWALAGAAVLLAASSQVYASFALGQVDASMTLLLAIGLWGYSRGRAAVTGAAVAAGAAIKLIPVLLLLYFLWKREYRTVAWGVGIGAALFLLSLAVAGPDTYGTYFSETLPGLLKGSTHYQNISPAGVYSRWFVKDLGLLGPLMSLDELPSKAGARALSTVSALALLAALAAVIGRTARLFDGEKGDAGRTRVLEYYLVVAAGLLISSVTWEFYVVWLLPLFAVVFLAPGRALPAEPRWRWALMAAFAAAFVAMNYPGGRVGREVFYDVNGFFYHPGWNPGAWVESDVFHLYGAHLTLVPLYRLGALALAAAATAAAIVTQRRPRDAGTTRAPAGADEP
jgi:hypothetical protein